ncbi:YciI family protein [Bailinhaonella thermotolerans]|uniref:YciI family protein n=1 Tax=Bailinhaonella thermotolerans TaxID=1070861 RepID=A0A3A4A563_9ACTN|nr:YciI family protein [Bailinhaonella thermotolerans]RJL23001.1 YciI family protein [Bailinhaonella thermotolerans]
MKYLLLIFQNEAARRAVAENGEAIFAEVDEIMAELRKNGEWVGGEGLAGPEQVKTVRVRDGVPAVTDGPYGEAKEFLAGYTIVECSRERAVEIAARWPDARYARMEVWPLLPHPDESA